MNEKLRVPAVAKQPHSMIEPPPCFTVNKVFFIGVGFFTDKRMHCNAVETQSHLAFQRFVSKDEYVSEYLAILRKFFLI